MLDISVVAPLIRIQMNTTKTEGPPNVLGTGENDIVLPRAISVVLETKEKDIFFFWGDQANNGTGIPC